MPQSGPAAETPSSHETTRAGLAFGLSAYVWWGLCPLYFKRLAHIPPTAVLAHRIAWSILLLVVLITVLRQWSDIAALARRPRVLAWLALTAVLLAINWLVFIYAVGHGRTVEASLGYFINPLVTVVLGMVVLGERLRPVQWAAVGIAAVGVAWFAAIAVSEGGLPWIAVALPASFGLYSLLRKMVPAGPLAGLSVETAILTPAAAVYLAWFHTRPDTAALNTAGTIGLLSLSGIVTTVPMLSFVAAAKRLPLTTVGFLQYVNPTLQFLTAVLVFQEKFERGRAVAFVIIWVALALYIAGTVRASAIRRRDARVSGP